MGQAVARIWKHVAQILNGHTSVRYVYSGAGHQRKRYSLPSLQVEIQGVSIHGEVTGEGDPPSSFVELSARVPGAQGLQMRCYRNYSFSSLGRVIGLQDLIVGDPHFDRNFIVKSLDPYYAKIWLPSQLRKMMLQAPDYCFKIENNRASATTHIADNPVQLESALRCLALISNQGMRLNDDIVETALRLGGTCIKKNTPWFSSGNPEFEFISSGRRALVTILHGRTGRRAKDRLLTVVQCRRLTSRRDQFIIYADHLRRKERPPLARKLAKVHLGKWHPAGFTIHSGSPARLRKQVTEHWSQFISRLAPLVLRCSDVAIELIWPGGVLQENLLRNGAELCNYFAVETHKIVSNSPYR